MAELIFFLSLFFIGYVYLGYPLLALILGMSRQRGVRKKTFLPAVTLCIAAFNEEQCIEATIRNKLDLDYPNELLEILVISDGSTDGTEAIVQGFAEQGVILLRQGPRAGKTAALNLAVPRARGEIIVFSDANSIYKKDALQLLVANFSDPEVGYVTGHMVYTNPDGTVIGDGCSAYMKYENFLRKQETKLGSVVGVDGGIDAVRKALYRPMDPDQLPDFVLPLSVIEQGFRVVYEPRAVLQEAALGSSTDEYRMRVRVSLRALWALFAKRRLLFSPKNLLYAWQLWSHKVLRYGCFVFLVAAYVSNALLLQQNPFFIVFFILQNLAYLGAGLSPLVSRLGLNFRLLYFLYYFTLLNIASAHAFIKFILGQKQVFWAPRKG